MDDNTSQIHDLLRLFISDPIDRQNINEIMGNPPAWIDTYVPGMRPVIEKKYGKAKPRRNKDIPEAKLREYWEKEMYVENMIAQMIDTVYPG